MGSETQYPKAFLSDGITVQVRRVFLASLIKSVSLRISALEFGILLVDICSPNDHKLIAAKTFHNFRKKLVCNGAPSVLFLEKITGWMR